MLITTYEVKRPRCLWILYGFESAEASLISNRIRNVNLFSY